MSVLFISKGRMYRIEGGKQTEIKSGVLTSYTERIYASAKRNEWKTQGKGAVFTEQFDPDGDADSKVRNIKASASALCEEGSSLIYSQTIDDFSGIFIKKESAEDGIIYSDSSETIREFDLKKDRIAASVGHTYGSEAHIGIIEAGKNSCELLTEGDSEDRYPCFSKFEENVIYYSSRGLEIKDADDDGPQGSLPRGFIAMSAGHEARRSGPAALCRLDMTLSEAEEILSDPEHDYIKPSTDEEGNLYFIRKPYESEENKTSVLGCLSDILFFPIRLIGGIVGFFNFLSIVFSGKNLRKSRDNAPEKTSKKSRERMYIEGNMINASKELKKNSAGSEPYPGIIPASYELCRLSGGKITVLKKGVIAYAIDEDGILVSNGSSLIRLGKDGKQTKISDAECITFIKSKRA